MLMMEHIIDFDASVLFLSETWLTSQKNSITAKFKDYGYELYHNVRKGRSKEIRGGVGILVKSSLHVQPVKPKMFQSFEHCILKLFMTDIGWLTLVSIYRLDYVSITCFFEEFTEMLETLSVMNGRYIIAGDMNIHCDDPQDLNTIRLYDLLSMFNLRQIIDTPTHRAGHTLDVVILQIEDVASTTFDVNNIGLSDHFLMRFSTTLKTSKTLYKDLTYRKLNNIDMVAFRDDVKRCLSDVTSHNDDDEASVGEYVSEYDRELSAVLNKHAPVVTKRVKIVENAPWFDDEYRQLRKRRRNAEKKFKRTNNLDDKNDFIELRKETTIMACRKKKHYYSSKIEEAISKPKCLYGVVNKLLDAKKESVLPTAESDLHQTSNHSSRTK